MKKSMTRWTMAGCMALAALGAAAVLDVGAQTAEAAPSVSPFAGTYVWEMPSNYLVPWLPVTISDGGRITGWATSGGGEFYEHEQVVSVDGRVGADGSYSFKRTSTGYVWDGDRKRRRTGQSSAVFAGTMEFDIDGNIVGTATTGDSFVWFRQ